MDDDAFTVSGYAGNTKMDKRSVSGRDLTETVYSMCQAGATEIRIELGDESVEEEG